MADGNIHHLRRPLRVVEQSPAWRHHFPLCGPKAPREPHFRHSAGEVYLGSLRLSPEAVAVILRDYEREALKSGDWSLHDELQAARDGLAPNSPEAA